MRTEVSGFVVALPMPRKSMNEIKILTGQVNGNKILKRTQTYQIFKEVKEEKPQLYSDISFPQKIKLTEHVIAAIAAADKEDSRQTVQGVASAHCQSKDTIRRIPSEDLGLVKKSARWIPKLLNKDQKKDRVGKDNGLL
jgi:hypothetical protein